MYLNCRLYVYVTTRTLSQTIFRNFPTFFRIATRLLQISPEISLLSSLCICFSVCFNENLSYDLEIKKFWNKFGKICGIIFWKIFLFGYGWWRKLLVKGFLKLWCCQIIWLLFAGFKTIIFCFVHTIWFMKYVFPVKICFVKTLIRIMKYKSHVIKSNLILSTPLFARGGSIFGQGLIFQNLCKKGVQIFLIKREGLVK